MRGSEELSIVFTGEEGHDDPIWGKSEMSAHRRVSRRVCGWRMESGSRQSCGWVLVGSNAERSAFELAGVSSRRWAHCGRFSGERARGRREWTRPVRLGRRRGGHAHAGSWRAGPGTTYGCQMSPMFCRRSATSTSSASIQTRRWSSDRATLTAIISQTKAN